MRSAHNRFMSPENPGKPGKPRQTGSHVRVRTMTDGEHHETIPAPGILKVGTLAAVIRGLCEHHGLTRDEVLKKLDL